MLDRLIKFKLLLPQVWLAQTLLTRQSMILFLGFFYSHLYLIIFISECSFPSEVKTLHGSLKCITSKVTDKNIFLRMVPLSFF